MFIFLSCSPLLSCSVYQEKELAYFFRKGILANTESNNIEHILTWKDCNARESVEIQKFYNFLTQYALLWSPFCDMYVVRFCL